MSHTIKVAGLLGLAVLGMACSRQPEPVVYSEPAPIAAEPVYNKY